MKLDMYDVVYVEDDQEDWEKLSKAISERNKKAKSTPLRISQARTPKKLTRLLSSGTRLVLADVYYPVKGAEDEPRLDEIIELVEEWSKKDGSGRMLPIIAYTGRGLEALEYCLDRKESLYDIWDKSTASPEYAAWRLSELSKELSRIRPDALTQRLIREMDTKVRWHGDVIDMTKRYNSGWSEYDQIKRAGIAIQKIAHVLGVEQQCGAMWQLMEDWEALSRAVSRKTRGHARHVINVFWLGYFLLNDKHLNDIFAQAWEKIRQKRMDDEAENNATESLCNAWYYAGLFHDIGGAPEHSAKTADYLAQLLSVFGDLAPSTDKIQWMAPDKFMERAESWLSEFDYELQTLIRPVLQQSIDNNEPDQGVLAAIHIRSKITEGKQAKYAREGARAISMHNLFPKLGKELPGLPVSWEKEPLVCLLLLCDQLQTWDRERGDDPSNGDMPSRAELAAIEVDRDAAGKPQIKMSIDYISPAHLDHNYVLYDRVRDALAKVLRDNPYRALNRIQKPWPFKVHVECTLSGEALETMHFGV
jgi:hypothetical protein